MIVTYSGGVRLKQSLLLAATCITLFSCSKVEVDLGTDFVDNSTTNLVLVDSSTIEISTVYVDSFITSGSGSILAGRYTDAQFGTISSKSFLQLGAPSAYTIPNGAVFDSLELILKLNKTFYGDTSTPYSVSVHQLSGAIKLPNEQYYFYSNNKRSYNTTALGSKTVTVRPATRDSISVLLSKTLGQELFSMMVNKDEILAGDEKFIDYFKGLAIVDGADDNLIMGFKDSVTMRLHYRNPGVISTDAYVDFGINNNANQFNNISADRTGTPIADLGTNSKQLLATQTGNAGFAQYISGAMVKIRFPYLRNILQLNDYVKIIRADLLIKPVINSFLDYYVLPPSLRLSATDQYNLPGTDLVAYNSSTGTSVVQYGDLYIDKLYGTNTTYSYDVTSYLQDQIAKTDINKNGLLLLPPNPALIFNRLVVADQKNIGNKTELKIYYATVK